MLIRVVAIMAAAFLLTGCGKEQKTPAPVAQPQAQPAPAPVVQQPAAAPAPVAPVVVTSQTKTKANAEPDLALLSRTERAWMMSAPSSFDFENFKAWAIAHGTQVPPPPLGKKYAFDGKMHVVLVNR